MSLANLLAKDINNTLGDDQGRWRQYVLDHLDYLANNSKYYEIDSRVMNLYRFDLKRFLKASETMSRKEDLGWIVLLLNNLHNDFSFEETKGLIIPTDKLVLEMYHTFRSISGNQS